MCDRRFDIVMAGTFAAWKLGTLQARALPLARELQRRGLRCAIVTVPWDMPGETGVVDAIGGVTLANSRTAGVLSFPRAVADQMRLIRSLNPRAVHVFKPKGFGGLSGWLLSPTYPLLIDSDDWEGDGGWNQLGAYSLPQRRLFDWQEQSLLRDAKAVTAASRLLVSRARQLRSDSADSVTWVPNGLDPAWASRLAAGRAYAPRRSSADQLTIALYSRFAEFPADWLPRYVASLSKMLPAGINARLMVIGDGPFIHFSLPNVVIDHMGYVAKGSLPSLLPTASIAVYPYTDSLIARSKNSVKLLELMSAGCAIIASPVGDIPAVAGPCAKLVDSSDPSAFAAATAELSRDPDTLARLSKAGQERVSSLFTVPAVTERLIAAYRNAGVLPTCANV